MYPFRTRDVPRQQFRFPKESGYFPRRPSTAGNQKSLPAALEIPAAALSLGTGPPNRASQSAVVPSGVGPPEGRCHRNSAEDPGPRGALQRLERKARETRLCPTRPRPAVPSQGCLAQPAAPPQLRAFPRGSTKTLPSAMSGPALPAASREVHHSSGAVRKGGAKSRESPGKPGEVSSRDQGKSLNEK